MGKSTINGHVHSFSSSQTVSHNQRVKHHEKSHRKPPFSYGFPMVFQGRAAVKFLHISQGRDLYFWYREVLRRKPRSLYWEWNITMENHRKTIGKWWSSIMGFNGVIPSGNDQQFAIENGHRNSEFSLWKEWFSIAMLNYQRVSIDIVTVK